MEPFRLGGREEKGYRAKWNSDDDDDDDADDDEVRV